MVGSGSNPSHVEVKSKSSKLGGIHSFSAQKGQLEASTVCYKRWAEA